MAEAEDKDGNGVETTVVLIGHGSKLPYNEEVLVGLRERMEMRGIFKDVKVVIDEIGKLNKWEIFTAKTKFDKWDLISFEIE